jgi:putative RNA 2'-phosphotransferase
VGLIPKSRLYVHLSLDEKTAVTVGRRHGKPVVYMVKAEEMEKDGYSFYKSVNGVWLTKAVPVKYLEKI